jgi:hypothetical protein
MGCGLSLNCPWAELGEQPENLLSPVSDLIKALPGERPGFENMNAAAERRAPGRPVERADRHWSSDDCGNVAVQRCNSGDDRTPLGAPAAFARVRKSGSRSRTCCCLQGQVVNKLRYRLVLAATSNFFP